VFSRLTAYGQTTDERKKPYGRKLGKEDRTLKVGGIGNGEGKSKLMEYSKERPEREGGGER